MLFNKDESGLITATCEICGVWFDLSSEWDRTNLDWHEHEKVGA